MKKLIYILIFIAFAGMVNAQWQPDVRLTNNSASSYTSSNNARCIATSGNFVHVVWYEGENIYYKRSMDGGSNWGVDTRLTYISGNDKDPSIAVSGSVVHVVWQKQTDNNRVFYIRSTDGGTSWGPETELTIIASGYNLTPSVSVSNSVVHVVWCDNRDGNREIYYKRSTDGGSNWGVDTRLTNNTSISYYPSISVSGSVVHVVWDDDRDGNMEIYYKRSTDGGSSWGADTRLTNNTSISNYPSISVSGSVVHVVWYDERDGNKEIYYKRSTDGGSSWGADTRLTNNSANSAFPSVSVSGSVVHVVWYDERDGNTEIYYKRSMDGGASWEADIRLTNNSFSSMCPFVSVSGSVVHVVWRDNRNGNDEIYYKRNPTGNARAILNSIYRPNDGSIQTASISLSDSACFGQIDSVFWYVNDSLVGRQHTMNYNYKQGTTIVKLIIKNNSGSTDSTIATVTRIAYKRYTSGQIFAGESLLNDNVLYAISTGDAVYKMDINGNVIYPLVVGGNVLSSCSIDADANVYIASSDNNLYGFKNDGSNIWPAIPLGGQASTTPTIDSLSNCLYVGVSNGFFRAINKTNGNGVWSYFCNAPVKTSAVISFNRKLAVASVTGKVYGFNLNNPNPSPPSWTLNLNDSVLVSPCIDTSGYFYFGSRSGKIYKVTLTGDSTAAIVWQTNSFGSAVTSSPTIDASGNLYVGTSDGRLYSVNISNGSINWYFQTDSTIKSTVAITPNGRIYFGNTKGEIFGIDLNKNVQFYYIDSSKISCAMLYNKGTLYFGNESGRLFALYDSTAGTYNKSNGSIPIWGTFQNNVRRTGSQKDGAQSISIHTISKIIPNKFELSQNYPNPFNPTTKIKFQVKSAGVVKLVVLDILGKEVATLVNEKLQPGTYETTFDAAAYPSGAYFYRIETGEFKDVKRMVLVK